MRTLLQTPSAAASLLVVPSAAGSRARQGNRLANLGAAMALALCLGAGPAAADVVTHWNEIALRAATAGRPGPGGLLDLALVHAAVHDAVQAYEGRFEPYTVSLQASSGEPEAAAAAAAYGVLVGVYPAQRNALDAELAAYLAARGLVGDPGLDVGQAAAAATLPLVRPVPNPPLPPYVGGTGAGEWRPTPSFLGSPPSPPSFAPHAFTYLVGTQPFTLLRVSQMRPPPPPPLTSERYRRDFDEVKAMGVRLGSGRTPEQTDVAYFWTDNTLAQWNRALRGIATAHVDDLGESARLFALANLAMADALIACWDSKLHYSFWRPVTAIREADLDGNPNTVPDPAWEPLINTPNYADYVSGANSLTGAVTTVLQRFFGTDELDFTVTSNVPAVVQKTRSYSRISDAAQEVVEARILLGIHFRFADTEARRLGSRVAGWAYRSVLRPLPAADLDSERPRGKGRAQ
jgi:hypothetical protein